MKKIQKFLTKTFQFIEKIEQEKSYQLSVGKTKKNVFNKRPIQFSSSNGNYFFETTTIIQKGVQTHEEILNNRKSLFKLDGKDGTLFVEGRYFIPTGIAYGDINEAIPEKIITGEIRSFSNRRPSFYHQQRIYRMIIPLDKKVSFYEDFTGYGFSVDDGRYFDALMKLVISETKIEVFPYQRSNKNAFLIIDAKNSVTMELFQRICQSVLLAYAFLKGKYFGEKCYILTYKNHNFKEPVSVITRILGGGLDDGFVVHSTKPQSIVGFERKRKERFIRDDTGKIIGIDDSDIKKYKVEFPQEVFSSLCDMICEKGGVFRAVLLYISNNSTTLELKIPTLFVAMENITKTLIEGEHRIIEDEVLVKEVDSIIQKAIKEINAVKRESRPEGRANSQLHDSNFNNITGKLHGFNRGSNNRKLKEPFERFGYRLTKEEKKLIIVHRNKFLHGDDFTSFSEGIDQEFRELFYMSLRLQKLVAVLLLKSCGYSGYILNQAKLMEHITGKKLKESVFVEI